MAHLTRPAALYTFHPGPAVSSGSNVVDAPGQQHRADIRSSRAKWGVIVPSTNTIVEHDFNMVRPHGITFHAGRMYIGRASLASNEAFQEVIDQIRESIRVAVRDVVTCLPDYLVMGMS